MEGRHFSSPILVNQWQTSSVFSSLRDLATCLSVSWGGDEEFTYLLPILHSTCTETPVYDVLQHDLIVLDTEATYCTF